MAGRGSKLVRRPATGEPVGEAGAAGREPGVRRPLGVKTGSDHCFMGPGARRPEGLAPQGKCDASHGSDMEGDSGTPPSARRRRLAAARRILRRLAMVGPSYEEMLRMEEEDRRANTEWLPGGKIGLVHGFSEFGARRDPEETARVLGGRHGCQEQGGGGRGAGAADKGQGAGTPPSARRRRLAAARRILRRLAMVGPSYEEMLRMEEEDRRANTEWLPGGKIGLVHGFSEFGARRDD